MKSNADQFDSPWKEALEKYLHPLLEFCFPYIADAIDWRTNPEFLDKELQEVVRDAALGKMRLDKLIKVQLLDGSQGWLLIHVEVQHRPDQNLPLRLYQYHRRLNDCRRCVPAGLRRRKKNNRSGPFSRGLRYSFVTDRQDMGLIRALSLAKIPA